MEATYQITDVSRHVKNNPPENLHNVASGLGGRADLKIRKQ